MDTDHGGWIQYVPSTDGREGEPLWREQLIDGLLDDHRDGTLFIAGCVSNQGGSIRASTLWCC